MKLLSLFIVIILTINSSFAIKKSSINLEQNPEIENTYKNIEQAELIETEVEKFKTKLIIIQKKYKLENDNTIKQINKDLGEIIYILRKIQTTKINKKTAEYVIKVVINDLKNINYKTKKYLKNYKTKLLITKNKYIKITKNLTDKLDKITKLFISYYKNKKNITKKDKEIIRYVKNIYEINQKIKNFKNIEFNSKQDMKNYLLKYFNIIKKDFSKIRQISKKK